MQNKEYIYDQLIAYLGNKRKLLGLIKDSLKGVDYKKGDLFVDIFSGSGVVSRWAKTNGFSVYSNDLEFYSEIINKVYIEQNKLPSFKKLKGIKKAFDFFNNLEPKKGWFSKYLAPKNTENYNIEKERMFYTQENSTFIDSVRSELETKLEEKLITKKEFNVLLAALIFQGSYVSNTSGVFKGFHNGWGGKTSTALYRIKSTAKLITPKLFDGKFKYKVFRKDANKLVSKLERAKVMYLDPPYNQHPYSSNYHVLNTISLNDSPKVTRFINGLGTKSAIRQDWKKNRRSKYNYKHSATKAFTDLIGNINAEYILVSYSTDGIINFKKMLEILTTKGEVSIFLKVYKRYVVGNTRKSKRLKNVEFILRVNTKKNGDPNKIQKIIKKINDVKEVLNNEQNTARNN